MMLDQHYIAPISSFVVYYDGCSGDRFRSETGRTFPIWYRFILLIVPSRRELQDLFQNCIIVKIYYYQILIDK